MPANFRIRLFALALMLNLAVAAPAVAEQAIAPAVENAKADSLPALRLKHWKASTEVEKNSFLFGFVTMLDLEKEWGGANPLPLKQSLTNAWVTGLTGVSVGQMRRAVDDYIQENPDKTERQVVEVLWFHFVQPKLSEQQKKELSAAHRANKK